LLFALFPSLLLYLNNPVLLPCFGNEDPCTPDVNDGDTDLAGPGCYWLFADDAAVLALG